MALVLVTGGSGFIGHHLVEALRARGQRVRVLDVRAPATPNTDVEHVHGSVLDSTAVDAAIAGVDQVYHLAGLPGMWVANKQDFHDVNCRGTEIVLAAARKRGVSRFLHCSTESILFPYCDLKAFPPKRRCSRPMRCRAPIRARSRLPSIMPPRLRPMASRL